MPSTHTVLGIREVTSEEGRSRIQLGLALTKVVFSKISAFEVKILLKLNKRMALQVGRTHVNGQAKQSFLWSWRASEDQSKVQYKDPDRSYKFGSGELILEDPDP